MPLFTTDSTRGKLSALFSKEQSRKNTYKSVFLLDPVGTLGMQVLHALAKAGAYSISALCTRPDDRIWRSRHCTIQKSNWSKNSSPLELICDHRAILLPVSTAAHEWVSRHAQELKKVWDLSLVPDTQMMQTTLDKYAFAQFLERSSLPVPRFASLHSAETLNFPFLIKPRTNSGGDGIEVMHSLPQFRTRLETLKSQETYFAQEWVDGIDVSYGFYCKEGEILQAVGYTCLTRPQPFGPFGSLDIFDDHPSFQTVKECLQALRWNGVGNIDLRYTHRGETFFLELNPRLWANVRNLLVCGINFPDLLCRSAQGLPIVPAAPQKSQYHNAATSLAKLMKGKKICWKASVLHYLIFDPKFYFFLFLRRFKSEKLQLFKNFFRNLYPIRRNGKGCRW